MARRTRLDDEVLELLADEPELLAIADAFAETQARRRRRVRPVRLVAALALVGVVAIAFAFAFWPGGGSSGISDNTAYAAIGGRARILQITVRMDARRVTLKYDRALGQLTTFGRSRPLHLPEAALPPRTTSLAPALGAQFGPDVGLALSLTVEYPELAKAGKLHKIDAPRGADRGLHWVSYRSALGYVVDVGLRVTDLYPSRIVRAGSRMFVRVTSLSTTG
jgi:hypothetical protein